MSVIITVPLYCVLASNRLLNSYVCPSNYNTWIAFYVLTAHLALTQQHTSCIVLKQGKNLCECSPITLLLSILTKAAFNDEFRAYFAV